jgi:hypothetical protein
LRDRAPEIPPWLALDGAVTQHLAAIRMLFDWLVTGHVIATNPTLVRGPKNVVKTGNTTVLTGEQS